VRDNIGAVLATVPESKVVMLYCGQRGVYIASVVTAGRCEEAFAYATKSPAAVEFLEDGPHPLPVTTGFSPEATIAFLDEEVRGLSAAKLRILGTVFLVLGGSEDCEKSMKEAFGPDYFNRLQSVFESN
jgi:hypothetical protein